MPKPISSPIIPPTISPIPTPDSTDPSTIPTNQEKPDDNKYPPTQSTVPDTPQDDTILHSLSTPSKSLPPWIQHDCKVTLQLHDNEPFHKGILLRHTDNTYLFHVGRSRKNGTNYPITSAQLLHLYNQGLLLRGHAHLIRSPSSLSSSTKSSLSDPPLQRPNLPTEHKPLSSWTPNVSYTADQLKKSIWISEH